MRSFVRGSFRTVGLLAIVLVAMAPITVRADLANLLTGHWAMDETGATTVVENSASVIDGTRGSSAANGQVGIIGGAYHFGGTDLNSYVDTNLTLVEGSLDFTLSAWVNVERTDVFQAIFSNGNSQLHRCDFAVTKDPAGTFNWYLQDTPSNMVCYSTELVTPGEWHHGAITRSGDVFTLWVDGVENASVTGDSDLLIGGDNTPNWMLGRHAGGLTVNQNFWGLMDDAASWYRALDAREIAAIAGLGEFSAVAINNSQIDDVLALTTVGQSAVAGDITWQYTDTFADDVDGATLKAGMHYMGIDGQQYIILDGSPGAFTGVTTEAEKIPGDANNDGKVDGSDVTILAGNWQAGVGNPDSVNITWNMGDFNGDGQIDGSDVTILAGNWQYGVTTAAAAVPEPSSVALLLSMLAATLVFVARRR